MSTTSTRPRPPRPGAPDGSIRPTTHPLREPAALTPAMRSRRAVTLLLMTLVLPGSAQVTAGNRRLGRIGLRVWFGLIACAVLLGISYLMDRPFAIGLFT